jgi:hypothetical protein
MSRQQRTQKSQRAITRRDRFCSEQGLFKRTGQVRCPIQILHSIDRTEYIDSTRTVRRAACKPTRACLAGWCYGALACAVCLGCNHITRP